MAVLTLPGADAVLAAQAAALPQPDQLCGPFAAHAALHAVVAEPPSVVDLALAAGTRIWPEDVAGWRPPGAPLDRAGWERLPRADGTGDSGTTAAALADGVRSATGGAVAVTPVAARTADDPWPALLTGLARAGVPVGVVANLRTGPLDPEPAWDVGHFVVLYSIDPDTGTVAVADSYAETGAPGWPPGCRGVPAGRLATALAAPPGRGLLLLCATADADVVTAHVRGAGLTSAAWTA